MRLISQFSRASGARFSETADSPETVVRRWILPAKLKALLGSSTLLSQVVAGKDLMVESKSPLFGIAPSFHSEPPMILSRIKHLPRHRCRKHSVRFSGESLLNLNRIPCQVGRCCPKASGTHFRVNVRTAWHRLAVLPVRHRRFAYPILRERLLVSAASHPDGSKNDIVHQCGECLAGHIRQQKLRDDKPTPGIPPIGSRYRVNENSGSVGRLLPIQHLHHGGPRSRKRSRGSRAQSSQPYGLVARAA